MSRIHTTLPGSRCVWSLILLCAATLGPADRALAQAPDTHLGVPANRMINLGMSFSGEEPCSRIDAVGFHLVRVRPNGNLSSDTFIVPANQVFVLTDITWQSTAAIFSELVPGRSLAVLVWAYPESQPSMQKIVHRMPSVLIPTGAEDAILSADQHLTAGLRIAAGHGICVSASQTNRNGSTAAWVHDVRLQGYTLTVP